MHFREFLQQNIVLLDGGTGTLLQQAGLPLGELPERWNLSRPDTIQAVHQAYFDAGSNVVCTNTFGANALKFERAELEEIVKNAVENRRIVNGVRHLISTPYISLKNRLYYNIFVNILQ